MKKHWAEAGRHTLAAIGVLPLASDTLRATIADPATGVHLSIAGIDAGEATCPSCSTRSGNAAFVAVVEDLRLLFACPSCQQVTWLSGA
jgi:uncharacterized Zn-finger protein